MDSKNELKKSAELLIDALSPEPREGIKWHDFGFWYWINACRLEGKTEDEIIEKWKSVSIYQGRELQKEYIEELKEIIRETNNTPFMEDESGAEDD